MENNLRKLKTSILSISQNWIWPIVKCPKGKGIIGEIGETGGEVEKEE